MTTMAALAEEPEEKTAMAEAKKHTISLLVENKFGAFNRIAGLFSAKGYNIDSLTVGPTEDDSVSRMTVVTRGDDAIIEQIIKQLNKLIDTLKVTDLTYESFVERDLALIKVQTTAETRSEIMQIAEIFRASIVDVSPKSIVLQVIGDTEKIEALETLLRQFGVKEFVRTGTIGILRGSKTVSSGK